MNKLRYILYTLTAVLMMTACADDISEVASTPETDKGIGEMVLFTSGTTVNTVTTRADGDDGGGDDGSGNNGNNGNGGNETPGVTYYMPYDYRFVCRMYYKASTSENAKYDVRGGTDIITWLKVGDNVGNSLYWRNSFIDLDKNVASNFDVYGNDAEANCLYWQNRKEHAFLAWTDLNRAKKMRYVPEKNSNSLKFVPADVNFEKHSSGKVDQWVDTGFEVFGVSNDFLDWESLRTFMETGDNYERLIKGKVPADIQESDFEGKEFYYAYGWSCRYSEALAKTTEVDLLHRKYGWIQYNMYYDKLTYTGDKTGADIDVKRDENDVPAFLFNTATNKYLAEIDIKFYATDENGALKDPLEVYTITAGNKNERTGETVDKATVQDDDIVLDAGGNKVAICKFEYNLTDEYGNVKYDEKNPRYTFYYKKLQEKRNQELVEVYPANVFDLTRGTKTSIGEQPDIALALTKQAPLGATQTTNRVNLYFKHQFSLIQVNLKSSADLSVVINKKNIQKVELLGVTEKGYVFTELNEEGEVEKANYESVIVSNYTEEQLKHNQYGTAFEMFDMATGKDENGNPIAADDDKTQDAGYPTGYMKAYNGIAFGQLQAIRITWNEKEDGSGIAHESTFKVTNETLKNLKSGCKYIWNIELRRGTLAIVRTEIVDWIVNGEGGALEYGTSGTISN